MRQHDCKLCSEERCCTRFRVDAGLGSCDKPVSGKIDDGKQTHFYCMLHTRLMAMQCMGDFGPIQGLTETFAEIFRFTPPAERPAVVGGSF